MGFAKNFLCCVTSKISPVIRSTRTRSPSSFLIGQQDIQKNKNWAGYGEQLLDSLAKSLIQEYGRGYSVSNLNDMRRFYEDFQILQTLSVESSETKIRQPLVNKYSGPEALQPAAAESLAHQISQTVSDQSHGGKILQTVSGEFSSEAIRQALPAKSSDRILIDLSKLFRLGWSHYRLLLSQNDPLKRKFYFEQAGTLMTQNQRQR